MRRFLIATVVVVAVTVTVLIYDQSALGQSGGTGGTGDTGGTGGLPPTVAAATATPVPPTPTPTPVPITNEQVLARLDAMELSMLDLHTDLAERIDLVHGNLRSRIEVAIHSTEQLRSEVALVDSPTRAEWDAWFAEWDAFMQAREAESAAAIEVLNFDAEFVAEATRFIQGLEDWLEQNPPPSGGSTVIEICNQCSLP